MARTKGAKNMQTLDVKELAQEYTADAVEALAKIMKTGKQEAARVAAANAILDRGHGKPKQALIGGGDDDPPIFAKIELVAVRPNDRDRPA